MNQSASKVDQWCLRTRVPSGGNLGVSSEITQNLRLQIGILPGVVFAALCNGSIIANHFRQLWNEPRRLWSSVRRHWILRHVHSMGESALHDVGHLSSLLFRCTPQESRKAGSALRRDVTTRASGDRRCAADNQNVPPEHISQLL